MNPEKPLQATILVTGGAGFIGSALVRFLLAETQARVINVDALTYAGNLESLKSVEDSSRYQFEQVDIRDAAEIKRVFETHRPGAVIHLAAESHVDRSIDGPAEFISTNINGTFVLLEAAMHYWNALDGSPHDAFRFLHVSTDEVYGSLGATGLFTEATAYQPNSPYSASKAASDHLVRAWHHTYGMPVLTTNCSNNYGPYQFPEKLIPLMVLNGLAGKPLPVYGAGDNVRDWLYVDDHARGLVTALRGGEPGHTYNIGGHNEIRNLEVVEGICHLLDELAPDPAIGPRASLIQFVTDRPGHDQRYAIDAGRIERELGWRPRETFDTGLRRTVQWYIDNAPGWCLHVQDGSYRGQRLGLGDEA